MTAPKKPVPPKRLTGTPAKKSGSPPGQSTRKAKPKAPKGYQAGTPAKPPRKSNAGRHPVYDWDTIRRAYVQAEPPVTLESLSRNAGKIDAPTLDTIFHRSAAENWPGLRIEFRQFVASETDRLALARRAENKLDAVDSVRHRHAQAGKSMMIMAAEGMKELKKTPGLLKPVDVARFYTLGADMERKAHGMEEITVNLNDIQSPSDLRNLSTSAILELIRRRRLAFGADSSDDHGGVPSSPGLSMGEGAELLEDDGEGADSDE